VPLHSSKLWNANPSQSSAFKLSVRQKRHTAARKAYLAGETTSMAFIDGFIAGAGEVFNEVEDEL
jgi:hypothetical protein